MLILIEKLAFFSKQYQATVVLPQQQKGLLIFIYNPACTTHHQQGGIVSMFKYREKEGLRGVVALDLFLLGFGVAGIVSMFKNLSLVPLD